MSTPRRRSRSRPQPQFATAQPSVRSLASLRALSLRQPYAWLIATARKRIEYRSWPTKIRERVLIYASLRSGDAFEEHALAVEFGLTDAELADLPRGVIVGYVEIVDCHRIDDYLGFGWHLAQPVQFRRPIAVPAGRQPTPGFWFPFPDK